VLSRRSRSTKDPNTASSSSTLRAYAAQVRRTRG
jgi:hypothetical protein